MRCRWQPLPLLLLLAALSPAPCRAQDLATLAYDPRPGAALPLDAPLVDEAGRPATLQGLAGGPPLLLSLGYFRCPNLCGVVRADALDALHRAGLRAGLDYRLAVISIDPEETAADAAQAKAADLARFPDPDADGGWRYLRGGSAGTVASVANAAGFRYRPDPVSRQFAHPAGLVVATPAGIVSGYLLGVGYDPDVLRAALGRAGRGEVAEAPSPVLLLCFHYDPATGRYTLAVTKALRLAGIATALGLGGALLLAHLRGASGREAAGRKRPREA